MIFPKHVAGGFALVIGCSSVVSTVQAQTPTRIALEQSNLALEVGDSARVSAAVYDENGNVIDMPVFYFAPGARRKLSVSLRDGAITALKGGEYKVYAIVRGVQGLRDSVMVSVTYPPVEEVVVHAAGDRFFVGATVRHEATIIDASGEERRDVPIRWSTSDPSIATANRIGLMTAHREGSITLRATAEGVTGEHRYQVVANPVRTLTLDASADSGRTGDVIHFSASALDGSGRRVDDAPITFTLVADPEDSVVAQSPPAEIDQQGRFVAQKAGDYTVMAVAPGHVAYHTISMSNRNVSRRVEIVGQGAVRDVRTSDLWIWEGVDGRDYAVTGTWGANGAAYFWDVTDPANTTLIDSVVVDARTVNDVKVSEDGRVAVISREGASNRRNGMVILDVTDPRNVEILSHFDDGLTGGVHNVFIYDNHVYAINAGRRFDVINIEDPRNPHRVGQFELDTPGHGIHDVWVVDGIAYTSNWADGVVLVDVGNGMAGGSPSNPIKIASYADFRGATHAAFPYKSPTGKFYVLMGDEIGRGYVGANERTPPKMAGYIHFVDFTDPLNPEEVARYDVPDAGSHNFWIEGDELYAAFYNGGLRVVDISGELKGNLFDQGREVAQYFAYDPDGFVANAPFAWGPQPYKGHIFVAEHHSGLWAIKLEPPPAALTP